MNSQWSFFSDSKCTHPITGHIQTGTSDRKKESNKKIKQNNNSHIHFNILLWVKIGFLANVFLSKIPKPHLFFS